MAYLVGGLKPETIAEFKIGESGRDIVFRTCGRRSDLLEEARS
ncbi:hypothetical protein [Pseudomonas aeruginosa]|nr:hypothetical protein [Pseudomonas aeruginosa]